MINVERRKSDNETPHYFRSIALAMKTEEWASVYVTDNDKNTT